MNLSQRLCDLADWFAANEYETPLTGADTCRAAAELIDRLPKTADGVPIAPGMELFDGIGHHYIDPWKVTGFKVTKSGALACVFGENGAFDAICSRYFSTREAAEKSRTT